MYEKKIDGVMEAPKVFGVIDTRKKRFSVSAFMTSFAKYLAYLLGVVLSLLLVIIIAKTILLAPAAEASPALNVGSENIILSEEPLSTTPSILPKVAVYYHGVRLGEYEGDCSTVMEVMGKYNIVLGINDVSNYAPEETVFHGMTLNIDEVIYEETLVDTAIPYNVVEIESQTIPKGQRVVEVQGVMGASQKGIRSKYVNGEITDENVEFERYIPPVDEQVLVGVGGVFTAPDGKEYNYSYYIDVTATAYTHTGDPTYMGTVAEVGVIAVDPRNIALGSRVYVIGGYGDYGVCRAEDIGGGIKGKRIDVFLDTEEECVTFGRRKMRAYVLE